MVLVERMVSSRTLVFELPLDVPTALHGASRGLQRKPYEHEQVR
jgi:hypothetical protein